MSQLNERTPATNNMVMTLDSLPEALVENIFKLIDEDQDQLSFRLVCRTLQKKCFLYFAQKFFNRLPLSLTRHGIERLVKVSNDTRFSPKVRSLSVDFSILNRDFVDGTRPSLSLP